MNIPAHTRPIPKRPEEQAPRRPSHPPERPHPNPGGDDEETARRPRRKSVEGVNDVDASGLKAEE